MPTNPDPVDLIPPVARRLNRAERAAVEAQAVLAGGTPAAIAIAAAAIAPAEAPRVMTPSEVQTRHRAGQKPLVPPIIHWVSPGLLSMVNHAPTNPTLRGAIRAELGFALRRNPPLVDSDSIREFVVSKFFDSRPWKERFEPNWVAGGGLPHLYPQAESRPPTPGGGQPFPINGPILTAAPETAIDPDGSFIMRGVRINGIERGRAVYQTTVFYTGDIRIPADIVREGRAAVEAYLRNSVGELEEDTENFIYGNAEGTPEFERGESGWEIQSTVLNSVQMDDGLLARARQQLGLTD